MPLDTSVETEYIVERTGAVYPSGVWITIVPGFVPLGSIVVVIGAVMVARPVYGIVRVI